MERTGLAINAAREHDTASAGSAVAGTIRTHVAPFVAAMGLALGSVYAEEPQQQAEDPNIVITRKEEEFKNFPPEVLVQLLDSQLFTHRVAADNILRARALKEIATKKTTLSWRSALKLAQLSPEQRARCERLLGDIEAAERELWWEPTMLALSSESQKRMETLGGAVQVLEESIGFPVFTESDLPPEKLNMKLTGIREQGTLWEVIRDLRTPDGGQLVPFLTNGKLGLCIHSKESRTASHGSVYAALVPNGGNAELRLCLEPKLYTRSIGIDWKQPCSLDFRRGKGCWGPYFQYIPYPEKSVLRRNVRVHITAECSLYEKVRVTGNKPGHLQLQDNSFFCSGLPTEPAENRGYLMNVAAKYPQDVGAPHIIYRRADNTSIPLLPEFHRDDDTAGVFRGSLQKPHSADVFLPRGTTTRRTLPLDFKDVPHERKPLSPTS